MVQDKDIRSKQRFGNFEKAFKLYQDGIKPNMSKLEEEGLIHRFEYTFELAWKCLQDLLQERGYTEIRGPRPVIEQSFQDGIITDGLVWMDMLKARNETTHLYDEAAFKSVCEKVKGPFLKGLREFKSRFPA